eukprot:12048115-Ditylum_brightwellii.AAC.1
MRLIRQQNSLYKPDEEDDESVTNTDADIAGVYEDTTARVTTQTEENQNSNKNDDQIEAYSPEPHITGFTALDIETTTPGYSSTPITYNSEPCHKNDHDNETSLIAETSNSNKK